MVQEIEYGKWTFLVAGMCFFRLNQPLDQPLKEISKSEAMLKISTTNTVEMSI